MERSIFSDFFPRRIKPASRGILIEIKIIAIRGHGLFEVQLRSDALRQKTGYNPFFYLHMIRQELNKIAACIFSSQEKRETFTKKLRAKR